MSTVSPTKILLTGATGYIGGSVLSQLLDSPNPLIRNSQISILIRDPSRAPSFSEFNVTPIPFRGLDDLATIETAASQHDIVLNIAHGFHIPSALSLIKGLSHRNTSGRPTAYFHTDGTSTFGDQCITGTYIETREFSDLDDDLFEYLVQREAVQSYDQRAATIAVISAGKEFGVPVYDVCPPMVFGRGLGERFGSNLLTFQVPLMMRRAVRDGQASMIGDGRGEMDFVHVADLARFYEMLLGRILKGEETPSGEKGIMFVVAGRFVWEEVAEGIADAGFERGVLRSKDVLRLDLREGAEKWTAGNELYAEAGLASNGRTRADYAKTLGWKPVHGKESFKAHFAQLWDAVIEEGKLDEKKDSGLLSLLNSAK